MSQPTKKQHVLTRAVDADVIATSDAYSKELDLQIGRYFYATNTPFLHADHSEFKKMLNALRPGYKGPTSYQIGGPILNEVYDDILKECKNTIQGQTVCMSLDGWSNVHNEPVVCCSIITQNGESFLVDTIETGAESHTAEYLKTMALKAIKKTETQFEVKVKSFVTDNTGNVQKMRSELEKQIGIIQYGCSAHILNLLAKDLEIPSATSNIIKVIKYFRNKHVPSGLYRDAGGKKLVMPLEIRWSTMNNALKSFLDNRGVLVQLCQDHKDAIESDIIKIVNDAQIAINANDLIARLDPIAIALDRVQRDYTTISICVEVWHKLEMDLSQQPLSVKKSFFKRKNMALGPIHYLANIMDHRFLGRHLTSTQKGEAFEYLNNINSAFIPFVMSLMSKVTPFPKYFFGDHFRVTPPITWWKSVPVADLDWPDKSTFLQLCEQLHSAVASTAAIERTFSSFGLIQSDLRNRLGNQKASKLVFMFKCMNQNIDKKKTNLEWAWEPDRSEESEVSVTNIDINSINGSSDDDMPISMLIK